MNTLPAVECHSNTWPAKSGHRGVFEDGPGQDAIALIPKQMVGALTPGTGCDILKIPALILSLTFRSNGQGRRHLVCSLLVDSTCAWKMRSNIRSRTTQVVEDNARIVIYARTIGASPHIIPDDVAQSMHQEWLNGYSQDALVVQ